MAFWYIVMGYEITQWREVGPFPTIQECKVDQTFYTGEGLVVSECYAR